MSLAHLFILILVFGVIWYALEELYDRLDRML